MHSGPKWILQSNWVRPFLVSCQLRTGKFYGVHGLSGVRLIMLAYVLKCSFYIHVILFIVHEREAHRDLVDILDEFQGRKLPDIVVHCFTGNLAEVQAYLKRGFYIGFTGTFCKKERGKDLRELLPTVPLDRIMIETDAPFMGFVKGRRNSCPADCILVAKRLSEVIGVPEEEIKRVTSATSRRVFRLGP